MKKYIILCIVLITQIKLNAQSNIDENKILESCVFLNFDTKDGKIPVGSGFFFKDRTPDGDFLYLITARHVLGSLDISNKLKLENDFLYISYRDDIYSDKLSKISIDLKNTLEKNYIQYSSDIAICLLGKVDNNTTSFFNFLNLRKIKFDENISINHLENDFLRKLNDVKIGIDVYFFGYPRALGIDGNVPQFDFNKPLVKKGIVAGVYKDKKSIIIDGSSFGGNSGGPVFGIFPKENVIMLLGVIVEYIPINNDIYFNKTKAKDIIIPSNSGYSVALSSDIIEEILLKFRETSKTLK